MPLASVSVPRLNPDLRQYIWAPLLVLLVGLTATAVVAWQMWRMAAEKDFDRFGSYLAQTQQNLNQQMEAYSALLRDSGALFIATGRPARAEFLAHVEHLGLHKPAASSFQELQSSTVRYPALLGLGWIRRDGQGKPEVAAPPFLLPDEPRGRYLIDYVEPPDWRSSVVADPAIVTSPGSLAAMAEARDSGKPTASERFVLSRDSEADTGSAIHVFLPVYFGGRTPATVAERRNRMAGLVEASLLTDELLNQAHAGLAYREVSLYVYEGGRADPATLMYRSENLRPAQGQGRESRLSTTTVIDVAGRTWTLVFRTKPAFDAASDRRLIPTVLLVGVLISLLLAGTNLFQSRARSALNASEISYRRLFEASPDGVFLLDAESGLLTDVNPYMAALLGQPREKLIGKALWEIGLFPDEQLGRNTLGELQEKDFHRIEQLPVTTHGGQHRFVDLTCNAYRTSGKRVMQCNVRDITDRKKAESALRDSEERYRTLVEVSPQGVWVAGPDGALIYINQYWIEYSGMSLEHSAGTGWYQQVHPVDRDHMHETWREALRTGATLETELRLRRLADGDFRWHLVRGVPVRDAEGQIEKWLGVFVDIHERKQTEQERAQTLAREHMLRTEAEAANRAKDDFLATLSHELRTPLNAILGWTQTLQRGEASKDALVRALMQIETSANAQAKLINDLLNVADIGAGRLRLEIQPVSLVPLVKSVAESLLPAIEAREIDFETDFQAEAGNVSGDPVRLQQIVWNLLSNAVKFTPRKGRICLALRRLEFGVELSVADTGEGIGAEFLPFVFDPFRQEDASIKRRHGGLGLGLAIVRHLVELHGGSVSAHSDGEGRGSRFSVQLPIRARQETANTALERAPASPGGNSSSKRRDSSARPLAGLRIVSVDDDPSTREMLHEALARAGADVASAASAQEALATLQSVRPDVLVSDIGLPDEDGYDLIRKVRTLSAAEGGATPAIALTGFARAQDRQAVLAVGYQAFVAKPVNLSDLMAIIVELGAKC
ncbi:MAG TPA: PAS domain S-box protein [Burkholderiales bacterium]|nr:PAS domain S-box protein [Burkholderiales bacterium]